MTTKLTTWARKESKQVADCRVFKLREDFSESTDGKDASFFVIESPEWVNIIPVTKDGNIVLIEQYRHGIDEITLEIPGGLVDDGEDAGAAAERELIEETGYVPREVVMIGKSRPNPAIQDNWVYHYLAIDCELKNEVKFDDHESIQTRVVPMKYMPKLLMQGKITHSLVIAAFHWFSLYMYQETTEKNESTVS